MKERRPYVDKGRDGSYAAAGQGRPRIAGGRRCVTCVSVPDSNRHTRVHGLRAGVLPPHRERLGTGAVSYASLDLRSQLTEKLNKRLQYKWSWQQKSPLQQQFKCNMFSF